MSDNRIIKDTPIGTVQAWNARAGEVAVCLGFYAGMQYTSKSKTAYVQQGLYLSASDAREIARVLIEAADHADKVRIVEQEAA